MLQRDRELSLTAADGVMHVNGWRKKSRWTGLAGRLSYSRLLLGIEGRAVTSTALWPLAEEKMDHMLRTH